MVVSIMWNFHVEHQKTDIGEKSYEDRKMCSWNSCHQSVYSRRDYKVHEGALIRNTPFTQHQRIPNAEKPYECGDCRKMFHDYLGDAQPLQCIREFMLERNLRMS